MDNMVPNGTLVKGKLRGRPPSFDRNAALRQAMRLFWDRGFEGSTFDNLLTVMGISASSFQNSFGSKHDLYAEATRLYLKEKADWFGAILKASIDTRQAFKALFEAAADAFTTCNEPAGCMISLAGTYAAPVCDPIRDMMVEQRALSEHLMSERLQQGIDRGELARETDPVALAAFFNTVFRGMAVQARDGANRERLLQIGRLAMRAWPE
jgi:AcrR family transcriptional regulator